MVKQWSVYSTISDTSESKGITTPPFTVTTNRDDTIGNTSTISETRETKSTSDIVEVLTIVSSRFVVTVNGGAVILLVSLVSDNI
jgi:hypothetical protein